MGERASACERQNNKNKNKAIAVVLLFSSFVSSVSRLEMASCVAVQPMPGKIAHNGTATWCGGCWFANSMANCRQLAKPFFGQSHRHEHTFTTTAKPTNNQKLNCHPPPLSLASLPQLLSPFLSHTQTAQPATMSLVSTSQSAH